MKLAFEIGKSLYLYDQGGGYKAIETTPWGINGQVFLIFWTIIKNLYMLTGVILLFFLISGGVGMIINAGNADKLKQSSQTLTSAVVGYLIMFAAYWIVRIVETVFGVPLFNLWFL